MAQEPGAVPQEIPVELTEPPVTERQPSERAVSLRVPEIAAIPVVVALVEVELTVRRFVMVEVELFTRIAREVVGARAPDESTFQALN